MAALIGLAWAGADHVIQKKKAKKAAKAAEAQLQSGDESGLQPTQPAPASGPYNAPQLYAEGQHYQSPPPSSTVPYAVPQSYAAGAPRQHSRSSSSTVPYAVPQSYGDGQSRHSRSSSSSVPYVVPQSYGGPPSHGPFQHQAPPPQQQQQQQYSSSQQPYPLSQQQGTHEQQTMEQYQLEQQRRREQQDQYFNSTKAQLAEQERLRSSSNPYSMISEHSIAGPAPPPYTPEPSVAPQVQRQQTTSSQVPSVTSAYSEHTSQPNSADLRMTFLEREANHGSDDEAGNRPTSEYYGPVSPISGSGTATPTYQPGPGGRR